MTPTRKSILAKLSSNALDIWSGCAIYLASFDGETHPKEREFIAWYYKHVLVKQANETLLNLHFDKKLDLPIKTYEEIRASADQSYEGAAHEICPKKIIKFYARGAGETFKEIANSLPAASPPRIAECMEGASERMILPIPFEMLEDMVVGLYALKAIDGVILQKEREALMHCIEALSDLNSINTEDFCNRTTDSMTRKLFGPENLAVTFREKSKQVISSFESLSHVGDSKNPALPEAIAVVKNSHIYGSTVIGHGRKDGLDIAKTDTRRGEIWRALDRIAIEQKIDPDEVRRTKTSEVARNVADILGEDLKYVKVQISEWRRTRLANQTTDVIDRPHEFVSMADFTNIDGEDEKVIFFEQCCNSGVKVKAEDLLAAAIAFGDLDIIRMVSEIFPLSPGVDESQIVRDAVNAYHTESGFTPLHLAFLRNALMSSMFRLCQSVSNGNISDLADRNSVLHDEPLNDVEDRQDLQPFIFDFIAILLLAGADPDAGTREREFKSSYEHFDDMTRPLMLVRWIEWYDAKRQKNIVKMLLLSGANPKLECIGLSPAYDLSHNLPEVICFILENGGKDLVDQEVSSFFRKSSLDLDVKQPLLFEFIEGFWNMEHTDVFDKSNPNNDFTELMKMIDVLADLGYDFSRTDSEGNDINYFIDLVISDWYRLDVLPANLIEELKTKIQGHKMAGLLL